MLDEDLKVEKAFDVIGISARTTNNAEFSGAGVIASLWQRFFSENIIAKIPNKVDTSILAVYCDYQNNKNGEYTILIGMRVTSIKDIPEGLVSYHVPEQSYKIFPTKPGVVWAEVVEIWKTIWALEDQGLFHRAYKVDYELYDELSSNPNNGIAEIHISCFSN
ncbi:MAG TPA: GyrI-like domain-containing protein [Candidatus Babeliales bacterium]|jgi:predicted transcriptional regulator YdeE|nr:GyrI-like domain-containing protein [Candidatus Babeliales bacterium]